MGANEQRQGSARLGRRLRELRGPRTQAQAAVFAGVDLRTWQKLEIGEVQHPKGTTLRKIAEAFEIDLNDLWNLLDTTPLAERFSDEELDRLAARLAPLLALHLRRLDRL